MRNHRWSIGFAGLLFVTFGLGLAASCSSCGKGPGRVTSESVMPGNTSAEFEIVVEWPEGVEPEDVWTGEVNGHVVHVGTVEIGIALEAQGDEDDGAVENLPE